MYKDTINILCSTDDNYAPYCGIMLTSMFRNNPDCQFNIFIFLHGELSRKNERKMISLEKSYDCSINLINIAPEKAERFIVNSNAGIDTHTWITAATFFRLLAADLLPSTIHKVLYLDCDIIIKSNIIPLWETDLDGKAFAGVLDDSSDDHCTRLGYPTEDLYINAGVALYNLDYWRENNATAMFLEYMTENKEIITLMDQDIINGVLHGKGVIIPERYNFLITFYDKGIWEKYSDSYRSHILEESNNAVVIHYCERLKPWDYKYIEGPFWRLWNKYRRKSIWKNAHITTPLDVL